MRQKAMVYLGKNKAKGLETVTKLSQVILADYGESVLVLSEPAQWETLKAEGYRVREIPEVTSIRVGGFELDLTHDGMRSSSPVARSSSASSGRSYYLLQLAGPMHPDWKRQLERNGVRFWQTIADDVYLIEVDSDRVNSLQALAFVESVLDYQPSLKINPTLLTQEVQRSFKIPIGMSVIETATTKPVSDKTNNGLNLATKNGAPVKENVVGNLELVLFDERDQIAVVDAVRAMNAKVIKAAGKVIIVYASLELVPRLAAIPQVKEINPYSPPKLHNNVATGLITADVLQNGHALDGSGQIVAIADTGLDTGVNDATMLDDFEGRIEDIFALARPGDASDLNGHGTHVAGSVLGSGANSNGRVRGIAPAARVVFQSVVNSEGGFTGLPTDLGVGLFDVARDNDASIHTNSWGADVNGAYNANAGEADTFAFNNREFLICFSAGNDAPDRVGSPGTAKNVLTVGASESLRALPAAVNFPASPAFPMGATASGFDAQADSQNEVAAFSSVGPAQNNRQKPDVVAPGSWILSTRSSVAVYDSGPDGLGPSEVPPFGTGDEDGVATHPEAVGFGLPGQGILRAGDQNTPAMPAGSGAGAADNYMYLSGTSMATPLTAGACALVRQYLIEQRGHTPSAALLKALIINGAVDMGMGIPDNGQGWGRVDLNNTLFPAGTRRIQFDDTLDNAVVTGDIRTYDVFVSSVAEPLAVTLVWRDPSGAAIQNQLHLRVTHVASGITSTADPIGTIRNNVQKVVIDPPQLGLYTIEVEGVNVTTGIPEFLPALRQDYALVVANATGFSCNPSDIVQVIDRSGSMGFFGYMEPAKERAKQMIDILQINDQAGVVTFAAATDEPFPLTLIDSEDDKNDAHAAITPIVSGGMTDLRAGLAQGQTTLGPDTGRPQAIVFLSDGFHTTATAPIDDVFLDGLAADGIKVYAVALGPDSDFGVLNNIAARTGTGAVYTVESAADLHKLHEIYYDIIGGLGCGGLVHLSSATVGLETGLTQRVSIDNTVREAHFAMSWETLGNSFDFTLRNPAGRVIDPASNLAFHFSGSSHQFYRVARPAPGTWTMVIKPRRPANNQAPLVTTAVLADSDVKCKLKLDPKFLFDNKLLLSLQVSYQNKPLIKGKATAIVTFPTKSIAQLLKRYANELKKIRIDSKLLKDDKGANLNLIRLGLFAARKKAEGKDIFERKQVKVALTDDGKTQDRKSNDGTYTAFFDHKRAGVAGNFQVQVMFEINDPKLGHHTCTKLIPVFVPQVKL
jgi:subtilisin family serine protease